MLAILPLVAGCPTEVPYQAEAEPDEAPIFDTEEPSPAGEQPSEPAADPDPPADEPPDRPSSPLGDRYATPPGQAPARMPWETDDPADGAPPEAERLFATAEAEPEPTPQPEEPEKPASDDGFGDFLGDAYAGMLDEKPAEETADPDPEPQPELAAAPEVESRYEATEPPQEEAPPPLFEPEPEPKAPTTVEPSNSELLDELWGDETATETPEPAPEPVEEPEPEETIPPEPSAPESPLPFGQDEQPLPADPEPEASLFEEPPLFTDEPATEPEEPAEPTPEPAELFEPTPLEEPEPVFDPPTQREPPMASSAIDPLPAVPVLPFNTRHLAWLLGAKYGLAELADLDGATDDEVAVWSSEVERLAEELRIAAPASARSVNDPAQRVGRMMRSAVRVGEALASAHGIDHAALLEISLKTNALLVVAEKRPDLAAPVARAVRDAADRALLPRFLWDQSVRVLENDPTPEEAHDAVTRLHERVESFLR